MTGTKATTESIVSTTVSFAPIVPIQSGGTTFDCHPQLGTLPTTALLFQQPTLTTASLSYQPFPHPTTSIPPQMIPAVSVNDLAQIQTSRVETDPVQQRSTAVTRVNQPVQKCH